jgi:hypothetical protein
MFLRLLLSIILAGLPLLCLPMPSFARDEPSSDAIIVYDVRLREFTCWREGQLNDDARNNPCDPAQKWHPISGNLYFVRGQFVSILLVNAVVKDLFGLDIKADDLTEPTTPISGSLSELPKLLPISPAPTVVPGPGATFSAKASPIKPSNLYHQLVAADKDSFKSWVQTTLIDPFNAKEVADFLAVDVKRAIDQLPGELLNGFRGDVDTLTWRTEQIPDPTQIEELVSGSRLMAALLDSESALKSRLVIKGVPANGKVISDALSTIRTAPLQRALAIDSADYGTFKANFELAFPDTVRYPRIKAIVLDANQFKIGPTYTEAGSPPTNIDGWNAFLQRLTQDAGVPLDKDAPTRLITNLGTLVSLWGDITVAEQRSDTLAGINQILGQDIARPDSDKGIFALQKSLNTLADITVQSAANLNAKARTVPLPRELTILPVGQWFSSKTITVSLKQGQRVALFDLSAVGDTSRSSVVGSDTPASKAPQGATTDLSVARAIQFPIYNLYHFKVGVGFIYSTVPDNRFQVSTVTIGSGSTATTEKFIDQTQSQNYTILGTANLMYFPRAQHAFPWRPRYPGEKEPRWYTSLAPMGGFSLTSPTKDFFIGGAYFPRTSPVGVQLGWHIALRNYPPSGYIPNQPIEGRAIVLPQKELNGFFVGLVFTTDFFGKALAPIFKP